MSSISFDRAADFYDATRGYAEGVAEQIRDAIIAYTGATLESRFLELGVGTGRVALPFIQAGYDFTGVDISQAMMDRLEQKLNPDKIYRYQLQQADITQLPFTDDSFNVAYAVHVFHLVESWQKAAQEAKRVLKPGGWLLVAYETASIDESERKSPASIVRNKWDEIFTNMGLAKHSVRPGVWGADETIIEYLKGLGATTEIATLADFMWPAISMRQMADRLINRLYSSDWATPDDVHNEASLQLEKWLTEECLNPDELIVSSSQFKIVSATWE